MNGWVCIDKTVLLSGYCVSKYGCNISFLRRWWIYTCLWKATLSKLGRNMQFKSCVKSSMRSELANKTLQLFTKMVILISTNILYPWKYSGFLVLLLSVSHSWLSIDYSEVSEVRHWNIHSEHQSRPVSPFLRWKHFHWYRVSAW